MVRCWCGNSDLEPFSPAYRKCPACGTLVATRLAGPELARVGYDEQGFYGRDYWFTHQEKDLGSASIVSRARTDLPERCLHWLRALLKYRLPPASILELGSAHGGFVALLRWAGYAASGLELSPWVAGYARQTFDVPMFVGPVEEQAIAPGSLDAIALMDVLEHLPDPAGTLRHCLQLLRPDGLLLMQTPALPEGATYEQMQSEHSPFLEQLKGDEHLYLFSTRSVRELLQRLGAGHVALEPAIFAHYDMFLAASRAPLTAHPWDEAEMALTATPGGRLVLALLDLQAEAARLTHLEGERNEARAQAEHLTRQLETAQADRAERLAVIQEQGVRIGQLQAERNNLQALAETLRQQLAAAEADRAVRGTVIQEQGVRIGQLQAERNNLQALAETLRQQLAAAEADRAARGTVIQEQGAKIGQLQAERNNLQAFAESLQQQLAAAEADRAARLDVIRRQGEEMASLTARLSESEALRASQASLIEAQQEEIRAIMGQMRALQIVLQAFRRGRVYRLLRPLGLWRWIDRVIAQVPLSDPRGSNG